jgi:hypothetical protein
VIKNNWYWLLLIVAALAGGVLAGKSCARTSKIVVAGKVYPMPRNGDTLKWVDLGGHPVASVQWQGPPSLGSAISPCTQQHANASAQSDTCTVDYPTTKYKVYHYTCSGCGDPGVGGGGSGGGPTGLIGWGAVGATGAVIVNIASGQAGPTGNTSGVWYFPSNGSAGGFNPIPVSTYPGTNNYDQVVWEPIGDTKWKVVLANGTCAAGEGTVSGNTLTFPDASLNSTCTIQQNATSQNYCVVYQGQTSGTAVLQVNNQPPTGNAPPCSLP